MVHALELVRNLLAPGGLLVDIHPSGEPPVFLVRFPALQDAEPRLETAGWLMEIDGFYEYPLASAALARAAANGWFSLEAASEFTFHTLSEDPNELFEYLKAEWSDALLAPQVIERSKALFRQGGQELLLSERVLISRYRRAAAP